MELVKIVNHVRQKLSQSELIQMSEVSYDKPVSQEEIIEIETNLSFRFPESLRSFYLNESSMLHFSWRLHNDVEDHFGEECRYGGLDLNSPTQIKAAYEEMKEMIEDGKSELEEEYDEGWEALVKDWSYWIPIISFQNGDAFCIDTRNEAIVYLEHDVMDGGPTIHGTILSLNFDDLIQKWSRIGFVEIYDWTEGVDEKGINISSPIFNQFNSLFK